MENQENEQEVQEQNQESKKFGIGKILIILGVLALIAIAFGFYGSSKNKAIARVVAEKDSISTVAADTESSLQAEIEAQKSIKNLLEGSKANLEAELDTIRPLAEKADSLKKVAIELQAQLAKCGKKGSKAIAGIETPAQLAKKLKGHPLIDDVTKTFTFVKSDKADSTLMAKAPKGYKLIEKPR